MTPMRVAILTLSDRCSRDQTEDTSGPALAQLAAARLNAQIVVRDCIPDDQAAIVEHLCRWVDVDPKPDLILTTGGTGLSPRDVTPEATLQILERRHAGLMELIRRRCYEKTPLTYLSRGEAGTRGHTLIINLPGSRRGAVESLEALLDVLPHAIATLQNALHVDERLRPAVPADQKKEKQK